jgi:hypothetical protein
MVTSIESDTVHISFSFSERFVTFHINSVGITHTVGCGYLSLLTH